MRALSVSTTAATTGARSCVGTAVGAVVGAAHAGRTNMLPARQAIVKTRFSELREGFIMKITIWKKGKSACIIPQF
jgi:hypothetical protein